MKQILILLLALILVACAATEDPETPVSMNTRVIPTSTWLPPTPIPSITPPITRTAEIPCDPLAVDFCITEGHFLLQRPIQPPGNDQVDPTYRYASTANGTRDPHHGVEFPNPSGTAVHAAAEGMVVFAGPDKEAIYAPWGNFYGNLVVIEHDHDLYTLYAHLSKIDVRGGRKVFAGDKIGEVGRTGGAIGSHLHFEVRRGEAEDYFATLNPELWLIPVKDENNSLSGTMMISVVDKEDNLTKKVNFTIGFYSDPSQAPIKIYYATPYSSDMLTGEENTALSELSAGHYRIVVETNGHIIERWVDVESGKLTQVVFIVK